MLCPRCHVSHFNVIKYEGIDIDRCSDCLGVWLDDGELIQILKKRDKKFTQDQLKSVVKNSFSGLISTEINQELVCPKCHCEMNSINFGSDSGIFIDRCPNDCGVWFDSKELDKVQCYYEFWQNEFKDKDEFFYKLLTKNIKEVDRDENANFSILFMLTKFLTRIKD